MEITLGDLLRKNIENFEKVKKEEMSQKICSIKNEIEEKIKKGENKIEWWFKYLDIGTAILLNDIIDCKDSMQQLLNYLDENDLKLKITGRFFNDKIISIHPK